MTDICNVSGPGCQAPAGWASDGGGIPSRAVIGRDHDGTKLACYRCGMPACRSCSKMERYGPSKPSRPVSNPADPFAFMGAHGQRFADERRLCTDCVDELERDGRDSYGRLKP